MEIQDPTRGLGVEPSDPNKVENSIPNEINSAEQNSMESLLGKEGLGLDFPKAGEIRQGVIAAVKENEILVSIGTKSEGVISGRELDNIPPEERASFQPGVEIPVYVLNPEDDNGNVVLSYTRAAEQQDWNNVHEYLASGEVIQSKVVGFNKGGLLVPVGRLRGFVPASQISAVRRAKLEDGEGTQQWEKMIGEPIQVRVIEVDRERRRLILSERLAIQETRESLKDRLLDELREGDVRRGRVTSVADFGIFVNIEGADGLVHLSEVSWERITTPKNLYKVGDEVQVKVISIDRERKRIGLSIRQLQEDPWLKKVAHLKEGQLIEGKITHLTKFGAFARIGEDLEGLIHLSELSDQHINHPKEVVKEGETLTLRIIKIDAERRRIGLSLRKVDSAAYADLDWKMALAEEVQEIVEEKSSSVSHAEEMGNIVEEAGSASASQSPLAESQAPVEGNEEKTD
ncbi:MAG: S1 RNA-binding domain-containing protein [Anaerolineales bacterium]|nr:S1 RNA-binding domain-containing protein [Anaerolineales bacterium]